MKNSADYKRVKRGLRKMDLIHKQFGSYSDRLDVVADSLDKAWYRLSSKDQHRLRKVAR